MAFVQEDKGHFSINQTQKKPKRKAPSSKPSRPKPRRPRSQPPQTRVELQSLLRVHHVSPRRSPAVQPRLSLGHPKNAHGIPRPRMSHSSRPSTPRVAMRQLNRSRTPHSPTIYDARAWHLFTMSPTRASRLRQLQWHIDTCP